MADIKHTLFTVRPNKSIADIMAISEEGKKLNKKRRDLLNTSSLMPALDRAGINTTEKLISLNFLELQAIKGIGSKAQQEIIRYTDKNQLEFKPHPDQKLNNRCRFEIYRVRGRIEKEDRKNNSKERGAYNSPSKLEGQFVSDIGIQS